MDDDYKIQFRDDLKNRLRQFVLDLINACKTLPRDSVKYAL
jgi:hypothetical protein